MEPRSPGSVTRWVCAVRAGAEGAGTAVRNLWDRYGRELEKSAGAIIEKRPGVRAVANEEDAALDGFHEFCLRLSNGAYPAIANRVDLWKLLVTITTNKARTQVRDLARLVRGGGRVFHAGGFGRAAANRGGLEQITDATPDPLETIIQAEAFRQRLDQLGDDSSLRLIVKMRLEGYSNEDIAKKLECHPRKIERKLAIVREKLDVESGP